MHALKKFIWLVLLVPVIAACGASSGGNTDVSNSNTAYDQMLKSQPGHVVHYSPTRSTINFWIDTWGQTPGKLAYVYLQNASGKIIGYYVFKGLPVTDCASLNPTQEIHWDSNGNVVTNRQSADGVYYSGGQCTEYYGEDAKTGAFVDYTVGLGINVLLYDQPLPPQVIGNAPNLAPNKP